MCTFLTSPYECDQSPQIRSKRLSAEREPRTNLSLFLLMFVCRLRNHNPVCMLLPVQQLGGGGEGAPPVCFAMENWQIGAAVTRAGNLPPPPPTNPPIRARKKQKQTLNIFPFAN